MKRSEMHLITRKRHEQELAGPFLAALVILTVIAFVLPLRPETSMREKRKLREFPDFTFQSLLSGDYFDDIGLWFSDTFPGREAMLEIADQINSLHGLNRNEVVLTQGTAQNDNADLDALLEEAEAAAAAREAEARAAEEAAAAAAAEWAKPADPDAVIEEWTGLAGEDEASMYGDLVVIDGTILSRLGFDQNASDHHAALMNQAGTTVWLTTSPERITARLLLPEEKSKRPKIHTLPDDAVFPLVEKKLQARFLFYSLAQLQFDSTDIETAPATARTARRLAALLGSHSQSVASGC